MSKSKKSSYEGGTNLEHRMKIEIDNKEKITSSDNEMAQERYKPKILSIVIFMIGMSLIEFAQKDLTGS